MTGRVEASSGGCAVRNSSPPLTTGHRVGNARNACGFCAHAPRWRLPNNAWDTWPAPSEGGTPARAGGAACGAVSRDPVVAVVDRPIPPILLVRLKARGPDGTTVGGRQRVCHLVPIPQADEVPDFLRAYCGEEILPGTAELLEGMSGMPCEPCLARSRIPVFAMLRMIPYETVPMVDGAEREREVAAAWWDLALQPDQKITARFVLLRLLQNQPPVFSVGEIALWLGQDPHTINLIMLLHAAVGWVQLFPQQARLPWAERCYRLTDKGTPLARRILVRGLTPTFELLADRLGLDTTVVSNPDTSDPGGCGTTPTPHPPGTTPDDKET